MREELDNALCQKYPYLFKDRFGHADKTCMVWGFSHDDGWYNIIDRLCGCIESHVKWKREQRAKALVYNRALTRAIAQGNIAPLVQYYTKGQRAPMEWEIEAATQALISREPKLVEPRVERVYATQVKEKFGALRFYYYGGDEVVEGMVRMAEAMSAVTCEKCGNPGSVHSTHYWVHTYCDLCEADYQKRKADEDDD